jgi:Minimal binding motif of Hap4 for binding to Hap2/3/5
MSPAAVANGPLSSTHIVPARPKPGRKTAIDEPSNKRKAQNRQAQRAFRQRKQEQAQTLEQQNKTLRERSENLTFENELLRQAEQQRNALEQENLELKRKHETVQQQLRAEQEKSNNLLNAQRTFQAQAREAIRLKQQVAELHKQLAIAQHHQRGTLPDGSVSLRINHQIPPRAAQALQTPPPITQTPAPPTVIQSRPPPPPAKKQPSATDGCGDCEETGDCACVDTFINATNTSNETGFSASFGRNNSTMSINSVLSPAHDNRQRSGSQQNVPDLMSDASSMGEEIEIDFTNFKKPVANTVGSDGPSAHQPPSALLATEDCGFCTDESFCACRQAELTASAVNNTAIADNGKGLGSLGAPSSFPSNQPMQPGTCLACQSNPEQKAFCESLARERIASRSNDVDDSGRTAKRPRLEASQDVKIPCADAYPLWERLSRSGSSITYDTLYKEFMQSQPNSRRGTEINSTNGIESKGRQYSAFEADIGAVLASLHRHGPKSSGSMGLSLGPGAAAGRDEFAVDGAVSSSGVMSTSGESS